MIGWDVLCCWWASVESGDVRSQKGVTLAGFVLAVAFSVLAWAEQHTGTGDFALVWAGTLGALTMNSDQWKAFARRHRATEFCVAVLLMGSFAKWLAAEVLRGHAADWSALGVGAASAGVFLVIRRRCAVRHTVHTPAAPES